MPADRAAAPVLAAPVRTPLGRFSGCPARLLADDPGTAADGGHLGVATLRASRGLGEAAPGERETD